MTYSVHPLLLFLLHLDVVPILSCTPELKQREPSYFCGLLWLIAGWPLCIFCFYRPVIMVKISFTLFNMEICSFDEIELCLQKSFDHNSRTENIVGTKSMLPDDFVNEHSQNEELPIIKHNTMLDRDFLFICNCECKHRNLQMSKNAQSHLKKWINQQFGSTLGKLVLIS